MSRNRLFTFEENSEVINGEYKVDTLENLFHRAMVAIYDYVLLERRYDANRFLHLLVARGGVDTAKEFLNTPGFGPGFEGLWQKSQLEKTMEYLVLQTQFSGLFTEAEKETASNRLLECGYMQEPLK